MKLPFSDKNIEPENFAFLIFMAGGLAFLLSLPMLNFLGNQLSRKDRLKSDILSCRSIVMNRVETLRDLDKVCGKIPE